MLLSLAAVVCSVPDVIYKFSKQNKDFDKLSTMTYNGLKVPERTKQTPRIYVVGLVFHEEKEDTNTHPEDAEYLLIDQKFSESEHPNGQGYTKPEHAQYQKLPYFELEYGREPLEYLQSQILEQYGLETWEVNSCGMGNQYGFDFKEDMHGSYPRSQIENLDELVPSLVEMGPLLGVVQENAPSQFSWYRFTHPLTVDEQKMWEQFQLDNSSVPTMYIGFNLGANLDTLIKKKYEEKEIMSKHKMAVVYSAIGSGTAVHGFTAQNSFIRMALMLAAINGDGLVQMIISNSDIDVAVKAEDMLII